MKKGSKNDLKQGTIFGALIGIIFAMTSILFDSIMIYPFLWISKPINNMFLLSPLVDWLIYMTVTIATCALIGLFMSLLADKLKIKAKYALVVGGIIGIVIGTLFIKYFVFTYI